MGKLLRKFVGLFTNNGEYHEYFSDPLDGPSYACHQYCKKCAETNPITGRKFTKLEKALK